MTFFFFSEGEKRDGAWRAEYNKGRVVLLGIFTLNLLGVCFASRHTLCTPSSVRFVYGPKASLTKCCYKRSSEVQAPNYAIFQRY